MMKIPRGLEAAQDTVYHVLRLLGIEEAAFDPYSYGRRRVMLLDLHRLLDERGL